MKHILLWLTTATLFFQSLAAADKSGSSDPNVIPVTTKQPDEKKIYPIAIIGAGAAGTMAANRAVLNNTEVLLFAGANDERRHSRGNWVRKVDNVPGLSKYKRTVLELRNEVLTDLVKGQFSRNLYIIEQSVFSIQKGDNFFTLIDGTGRTYYAAYVILATGIMDEQPNIQGSIRPILKYANGQTVAYCYLCDGHRSYKKKTAMIGNDESTGSIALRLSEQYQHASTVILTNGQEPQFSPELLKRIQEKNIRIYQSPIQEILGNPEQRQLTGFKLENGETIKAQIGFVCIGIRPNNELALQLGAKVDEYGLVIADDNCETSIPNFFVAGDLRSDSMKQIYTAWQHAVDSIQTINERIRE